MDGDIEDTPESPPVEYTPASPQNDNDDSSPFDHECGTASNPHIDYVIPTSAYGNENPPSPLGYEAVAITRIHDNPSSPPFEGNLASPQNDETSIQSLDQDDYENDNPTSPQNEVNDHPEFLHSFDPPVPQVGYEIPIAPPAASSYGNENPTSPLGYETPASPPKINNDTPPASPPLGNETPPASPPMGNDTPPASPPNEVLVMDNQGSPQFYHENNPSSPPGEDNPASPEPKSQDRISPSSPPEEYLNLAYTQPEVIQIDEDEGEAALGSLKEKLLDELMNCEPDEVQKPDSTKKTKTKYGSKHESQFSGVTKSPKTKQEKKERKESVSKSKPKKEEKMEVDDIEVIDPEDLEEGEIEDDEEEDGMEEDGKPEIIQEIKKEGKVSPFTKIFGGDKENHKKEREKKEKESEKKDKSRKDKEKEKEKEPNHNHNHHKEKDSKEKSKEKEKESTKDKDKDRDKKKKRKHSDSKNESNDEDEMIKSSKLTSIREKRSRRSVENEVDGRSPGEEDDDSYLFVRGGSPPSGLSAKQMALQNFANAAYNDADSFGRVYGEEDSDEDGGRRGSIGRRHRSPINRRRRENRDDNVRGGRRGAGAGRNKEEINKGAKSDVICAYYMQGKCQKSHEECCFSHNAVPPRKMELCKFWMMDCCAKREKCLYLHNDFPCKFYHTGLVCKQGDRCKFSHKPLNEVTKAVLLKHIETAPKEILGDFPRLNRNGALNLINKMEIRILGALAEQERQKGKDKDEPPRRTRWEQPTRDDQEKLQELMEEAGIGGFYRETLEGQSPPSVQVPPTQIAQPPPPQNHSNSNLPSLMGQIPFMPLQPSMLIPQPSPVLVQNAALANVLANLNIPSSTIVPPVQPTPTIDEIKTVPKPQISPLSMAMAMNVPPPQIEDTENWNVRTVKEPPNFLHDPPEHLPPMQKELFLRIQQQQLKNENKKEESDEDERPDDVGWYSSDDEDGEKRGNGSAFKDSKTANQNQNQQGIDISSVISSIRQTVDSPGMKNKIRTPSPPGRGDIDLRTPTQSHGPFGDTDFRLPAVRPDLRDIDLRMTSSPGPASSSSMDNSRLPANSNPLAYLKLPSGPATEIDASINSHPPMPYKLFVVIGVGKPDYRYIRHTLSPSQILMDPRLGPRPGSGTLSLIPDPDSPPPSSLSNAHHSPATIPVGDNLIMDPRVRRSAGQAQIQGVQDLQHQQHQQMNLPPSAMPGLLGDPRFPRDPRSLGWPNSEEIAQAALAAQFMSAQQQLGIPSLFSFPNPGGFPFIPPDFSSMGQGPGSHLGQLNQGQGPRGQFPPRNQGPGTGRGRPASSWERYSQQQSDPGGGMGGGNNGSNILHEY